MRDFVSETSELEAHHGAIVRNRTEIRFWHRQSWRFWQSWARRALKHVKKIQKVFKHMEFLLYSEFD